MNIWDREYETMPREELQQLQLERLQAALNRLYRSVAFYRRLFESLEFLPEEFSSLDELKNLPFTTRKHLKENHPYGMFAVPLREVVRLHKSSSATGSPNVVGYSANDITTWAELVARVMAAAGVTKDDVVQIAFDYGLFTSGFGLHYGAERLGASVIPTATANISRQVEILRDYRTTVLVAPPSVALSAAEYLEQHQIDPTGLHLKVGLFSGEQWSERMREILESGLLLSASDNYGVSEIFGPGIAGECSAKNGMHLQEDHFLAEVIDPETGGILPRGQEGELVLTTLTKEAFPLLRFRTGDLTTIDSEPCECGRTTLRIAKIKARTDDMLNVRGVLFYPSRVGELLDQVEGAHPRFQLLLKREEGRDLIDLNVEVSEKIFFDEMRKQRLMIEDIQRKIMDELGLSVHVKLVEPSSRESGSEEELPRVIDERPR